LGDGLANVGKQFGVGGVAALIEAVLLQPTLYWKNAKAQNLPMTLSPRVLYRGAAINIFNECQCLGVQFATTSLLSSILKGGASKHNNNNNNNNNDNDTVVEIGSAVGGGVLAALFAAPLELIMIQQQLRGGTIISAVRHSTAVSRQSLMRGLSPTMYRDSIYVGAMLGLTPIMQRKIEGYGIGSASASFYASIAGGIVAAVPSHPFDVVKTCLQGDLTGEKYRTSLQTAQRLMKEAGWRAFFRGGFWRTINITATVYVFCSIILPSFLVCDVPVSLLSMYCSLLAFSDST
jgi:hypothetical protein